MRKLTESEINSYNFKFKQMITSMDIEGIGEGNIKYPFKIELKRIEFDCDKFYLGIASDSDGKQTGYAILLRKFGVTVETVYITECSESEAFTMLGAYAGSVYMRNTLSDIYIRDYTNIQFNPHL